MILDVNREMAWKLLDRRISFFPKIIVDRAKNDRVSFFCITIRRSMMGVGSFAEFWTKLCLVNQTYVVNDRKCCFIGAKTLFLGQEQGELSQMRQLIHAKCRS